MANARNHAESVVDDHLECPDQWRWDGSAEALGAGARLRVAD